MNVLEFQANDRVRHQNWGPGVEPGVVTEVQSSTTSPKVYVRRVGGATTSDVSSCWVLVARPVSVTDLQPIVRDGCALLGQAGCDLLVGDSTGLTSPDEYYVWKATSDISKGRWIVAAANMGGGGECVAYDLVRHGPRDAVALNGCPFTVGDRVRGTYSHSSVGTVTSINPHARPGHWRVGYLRDGTHEDVWDIETSLEHCSPAAQLAKVSLPAGRPLSAPTPQRRNDRVDPDMAALYEQRLLAALQQNTLACRDCGHIFQPGERKLSRQRSADGRHTTALCEHVCWEKRLRC